MASQIALLRDSCVLRELLGALPNEAEAAGEAGDRPTENTETEAAVRLVGRQCQAARKTAGTLHKQRGEVGPKDSVKLNDIPNHTHWAARKQHFNEGAS